VANRSCHRWLVLNLVDALWFVGSRCLDAIICALVGVMTANALSAHVVSHVASISHAVINAAAPVTHLTPIVSLLDQGQNRQRVAMSATNWYP
jgi:hypothetical protein